MNDFDPTLDLPEYQAPDAPAPRPIGSVLRTNAHVAKDAIGDGLHTLIHEAPINAAWNERIRSAEGFMRAAELMLERALEELGPEPTNTEGDTPCES